MKISVKTLKGTSFEIEVDPTIKVADLKKLIEITRGQNVYPADGQIFIHMGKVLKDNTTLEENNVVENNFLVLMMSKIPGYAKYKEIQVPPIDLHKDLGKLLRSEAGADVRFIVSGESFAAHKNVLAARSPVFMAEFFGEMKERTSKSVVIEEMEAAVFKAMLHFIYTDTVPELDYMQGTAPAMAQHLLVAADRYGLKRLKTICERRIAQAIGASTVMTTLALAEQHNCSQVKAMCIEFIVEQSPENLDAIMASEEFKSLEASNPAMLTELFKAAHGRIKK